MIRWLHVIFVRKLAQEEFLGPKDIKKEEKDMYPASLYQSQQCSSPTKQQGQNLSQYIYFSQGMKPTTSH